MLQIIGTSHIAKESLEKVKKTIREIQPDCVAVELDFKRYMALKEKKKGSVQLPVFQKIIFKLLQSMQEKLSRETGVMPGQEMLDAVNEGISIKADIIFIDKDINVTVYELMKSMTLKNKVKLSLYILLGFFGIGSILHSSKKEIDLNKIPDDEFIDESMEHVKEKFPEIYKILVEGRNRHMARSLIALNSQYKNIVAVIGAGHVKGIKEIIKHHVLNEKWYNN